MTAPDGPRHDGYDDLRRVLQVDAERAAQADAHVLWSGIGRAVHRRRRRRRVAGAVVATTLSAVLATVVAQALPGPGPARAPDRLASGETSGTPRVAPTVPSAVPPSSSTTPSAGATTPGASRTPLTERAIPVTPDAARAAVRQAGYDRDDLFQLAQAWRWGDVQDVEVVAGARLLRGDVLPLRPGQPAAGADPDELQWLPYENLLAYAGAGYGDDDAAALAQRWRTSQARVRMLVGELVRADQLPPATS